MLFCPFCSSILVVEKQATGNGLCCRLCVYTYTVVQDMVETESVTPKKSEAVGDDEELRFAAKCEKKCSGCGCEEAMFIEMQTRSADEPMTIFYQCTVCRRTWRE